MFLWRLSKHSIPTNDVRAHPHMSDSSACGICGAPDSWRHFLLKCGFINRYLQDLNLLAAPTLNQTQQAAHLANANTRRPKAPPAGHAKIHVDAACRKGLGGAVAAVCCDETGAYLGNSALVIAGVDDPEILETIAYREALALAQDLNIQSLVVASGSKGAYGAINNRNDGTNGAIISEIHSIAFTLSCSFTFEGRAVNVEAYRLAKYTFSLGPGRHIWLGQPHDQRCIPLYVVFAE
ncbi:hypothetical protein VPH35_064322 [Triticum aestivum]